MKRLIPILTLLLAVFSGCNKVKDFKVTSFDLASVNPHGKDEIEAVIEIGIYNPMMNMTVKDISGTIYCSGEPCAYIMADRIDLEGHADKVYTVPVNGRIAEEFSVFRLIPLVRKDKRNELSVDLAAKVKLKSGIGKTIVLKNLEVK